MRSGPSCRSCSIPCWNPFFAWCRPGTPPLSAFHSENSDRNWVGGLVLLDAFCCGGVVLHLCEGKAVFGVFVPFGDDVFHRSALLEETSEFVLEFLGFGLHMEGDTFPSRLVTKSLVICCLSSLRERSLSLRLGLEELD